MVGRVRARSTPDSVEPMRFAAVDLVAGLLPASTVEPEPYELGVWAPAIPPKTVSPLPVAEKDQTPPPPQIAMKAPNATGEAPMPSFRVTRVAVDDALIIQEWAFRVSPFCRRHPTRRKRRVDRWSLPRRLGALFVTVVRLVGSIDTTSRTTAPRRAQKTR